MSDLLRLLWHLLVTMAKTFRPGGTRAVIAESIMLKHQLIVVSRRQRRAPKLTGNDRFLFGFCSLFLNPARLFKAAVIIKPSTVLKFHKALVQRKYHLLYTSTKSSGKLGPKGPSKELINAIVEMKQRNPRFGCPRIAQQISLAFGIDINKDVVRRVLAKHYRPTSGDNGPSWLTTIGHVKNNLWSIDLFRCESIGLKSHWVMVVMDQFSRKIIGFAAHPGDIDGPCLCRMFNKIQSKQSLPRYISSDNDPLFRYHRWKANLRILDIREIKTVPHQALSHPFVERLIGIVRREFLDHTFFWNCADLEKKLFNFQHFYNEHRTHTGIENQVPAHYGENIGNPNTDLHNYQWQSFCRGLFQLPKAV